MDPRRSIRNGFAHGDGPHSHFYAAWTSRHESSMIPKALKFATLQKKMAPMPHTLFGSLASNAAPRRYNLRIVTDIAIVGPKTLVTAGA